MPKIKNIRGRQVLDSRGTPTVMAIVELENKIIGSAITPSGASTGTLEAVELRDDGTVYFGKGVLRAIKNIDTSISRSLIGMEVENQEEIDARLCELDGTANKAKLGANATVAVSLACLRAASNSSGEAIYKTLGGNILPVPFMNVINGGKHAGSGLAVQEFMIAPIGFKSFSQALRAGAETYHALKAIIKKQYGPLGTNVGDEGGFAPMIQDTNEALNLLESAIEEAGYKKNIQLASDAAASSFYDTNTKKYLIDGKELEEEELIDYWKELTSSYPIVSLEDPFDEKGFYAYAKLREKIGKHTQIVGDDLTVTNLKLVKKAKKDRAINTLLLKVNQIGTISEAIEAAKYCLEHKMGVMVSHRSGETEDTTIADLSVGINCAQIKTGAPCRGERTAKYNRLLAIEEELGSDAKFLGAKSLVRY